jgi:hypothetical protein
MKVLLVAWLLLLKADGFSVRNNIISRRKSMVSRSKRIERDEELRDRVYEDESHFFVLEEGENERMKQEIKFSSLSEQVINSKENIMKIR